MIKRVRIDTLDNASINARRGSLDQDRVTQMGMHLLDGGTLPPIKVTAKTKKVWAGKHRIQAHLEAKIEEIDVEFTPEKPDEELFLMALKDNMDGSLPPQMTDITLVIKKLMDLGLSRKEIGKRLPFTKSVAERYLRSVHDNEYKQAIYRAAAEFRDDGDISVRDAAKKHKVKFEDLQEFLGSRKRKSSHASEFISAVKRRLTGATAANGKTIKKMSVAIDEARLTVEDGMKVLESIRHHLDNAEKAYEDWRGRFKRTYQEEEA